MVWKSHQNLGNPEKWIHKYLFKFHYIWKTLPYVFPWMFSYTHICNILHVSSASQAFPGILTTWHAELITWSLLEVTFWMSNRNFFPVMIHACVKDSSVLIQLPSMKLQFQFLFCELVYKCLIHPFLGESLVNPICALIFHSSYLLICYFLIQIWDHSNWPITISNLHKMYTRNKNCYN